MVSDGIKNFLDYLRDVEVSFAANSTAEVVANSETQDLLHFLELSEQDEPTMIAVCNRIKQIRNERREAKDYVTQAGYVVSWIDANRPVIKALEQLLGNVRKEERRGENRIFAPRTKILDHLTEQEDSHDPDQTECV